MYNANEITEFGEEAKKISPTIVFYKSLERASIIEPHLFESYTQGLLNLLEVDRILSERLKEKAKKK